jgi:hypothetical protein
VEQSCPSSVSPFFTSLPVGIIPTDSVVLTYLYPKSPLYGIPSYDLVDQGLVGQGGSGMGSQLVGGNGNCPHTQMGSLSDTPPALMPTSAESFFDGAFCGSGTPKQYTSLVKANISTDRCHSFVTIVSIRCSCWRLGRDRKP